MVWKLEAQGKRSDALAAVRDLHGDRHPRTMQALCALVGQLQTEGRVAEAEPLAREAAATAADVLGDAHPFALVARSQLAAVRRALEASAGGEADAEADV